MNTQQIGFSGGGRFGNVGTKEDFELFFACIERYAVTQHPELDWSIITDRLYKRYLRHEENERACELMQIIELEFEKVIINNKNRKYFACHNSKGSEENLRQIFSYFFESFF